MRICDSEFMDPFLCFQVVVNSPNAQENVQLFCSPTLKICWVGEGRGIWEIDGKEYPIEKGDIFILSNNESRRVIQVYPPCDMRFLILEFEPRFIWSNNDEMLKSGYLNIFFDRNEKNRIPFYLPIAKTMGDLIVTIGRELESKNPEYRLMVKVNVQLLLVLLKRHYSTESIPKQQEISAENRQLLEKVMDYIHKNYTRDIPLKQMAQMALMSQSKFSRLFLKYNGIGFSRYIMRLRVQRAVELLQSTEESVLDIAMDCGYHNATNFYKAFRNVTNKTPKDFRN